jgi:hypothetical protein
MNCLKRPLYNVYNHQDAYKNNKIVQITLLDINYDVLFEIMDHLNFTELIQIMKTCRSFAFNELFMSYVNSRKNKITTVDCIQNDDVFGWLYLYHQHSGMSFLTSVNFFTNHLVSIISDDARKIFRHLCRSLWLIDRDYYSFILLTIDNVGNLDFIDYYLEFIEHQAMSHHNNNLISIYFKKIIISLMFWCSDDLLKRFLHYCRRFSHPYFLTEDMLYSWISDSTVSTVKIVSIIEYMSLMSIPFSNSKTRRLLQNRNNDYIIVSN